MNDGSSGQEMERITNFYNGAEENPTAAQSAPTPRVEQVVGGASALASGVPSTMGSAGQPLFVPGGQMAANLGNSMNVGGYFGAGMISELGWNLGFLGLLPETPYNGGGGIPNADNSGTAADAMATGDPNMYQKVGLPGTVIASQPVKPRNGLSLHGASPLTPSAPDAGDQTPPENDSDDLLRILPKSEEPPDPDRYKMGSLLPGKDDPLTGSQIDPETSTPPDQSDTGVGSSGEPDGDTIIGADYGFYTDWGDSNPDPQTTPTGGWSSVFLAGTWGLVKGTAQGVLNTANGLMDDTVRHGV